MCKNKYGKEQAFEPKGAYWYVSDRGEKVKWQSQTKFFHIF